MTGAYRKDDGLEMEENEFFDLIKETLNSDLLSSKSKSGEVVNPERVRDFVAAYTVLRKYSIIEKGKISYKMHSPYPFMGYISISGDRMCFENIPEVFRAIASSTCFEVCTLANGKVEAQLTFHNLTKEIEVEVV